MKFFAVSTYVFSFMTFLIVVSLTDWPAWQQALIATGSILMAWLITHRETERS